MEGLEVENLACGYNGVPVVEDVSFTVRPGELLFILGPIGSGKTTILRCILGILKPLRGSIRLDGADLTALPPRERAKLVGYVPQQMAAVDLTVFDTVLLGRYPHLKGFGPSERDYRIVERVIRLMGLGELANRRLSQLSGGQLQKTAIARALAQEPRLLLLDEPTSNLDPRSRIEVMNLVRRIVRGEGRIAVIASHDLDLAARYADKLLMIRSGRTVAYGGVGILNPDNILKTYGLRVEIVWVRGKPAIVPLEES